MNITDSRGIDELFDLSEKVALVTGATGKLGLAICEALAECGCNVVVNSRTGSECRELADQLSFESTDSVPAPGDVTDEGDVESLLKVVDEEFGRLDILVNNAYSGSSRPFEDISKEEFNRVLETGLTSQFLCTRESLSFLKEDGGSVINVSSIYGVVAPDHGIYGDTGLNNPPHYGAAKAGVIQLTRWIATRYASEGIRANSITPGGMYDPEISNQPDYEDVFVTEYERRTPMGRMGTPEDIKGVVAYLASDASSWVTGENVIVDGGWTAW